MPEGSPTRQVPTKDIIVIGGSAGALQPLEQILADLPEDLPASVFIVVHLGASSHLAAVLDRYSALPVLRAQQGQPVERGRVYVGVPGVHLLLHDSHILLRRGPRENLARPAVDPLFRSAACSFGARVIGVVLSGALNDGTAGLRAIQRCGGTAIVQDPSEASFPSMPQSALIHMDVNHVPPASAIGPLLSRLAREPAEETPPIPMEIRLEAAIAAQEASGMETEDQLGAPSRFTCPECQGALWEIDDGSLLRYRCHVGHAFTAETMLSAHTSKAEEMLWSLMRTHQERAALARRLADRESTRRGGVWAEQLRQRAQGYDEDAEIVRGLLNDYMALERTADPDREGG